MSEHALIVVEETCGCLGGAVNVERVNDARADLAAWIKAGLTLRYIAAHEKMPPWKCEQHTSQ